MIGPIYFSIRYDPAAGYLCFLGSVDYYRIYILNQQLVGCQLAINYFFILVIIVKSCVVLGSSMT